MLNNYVVVGRLLYIQEGVMAINTVRSYKNSEGEYDSDTLKIYISKDISVRVSEYVRANDIVGIKGHIEAEEGSIKLIGDKISFLSSAPNVDKEADSDEE